MSWVGRMITCRLILEAGLSKDNHDLVGACLGASAARFAGWLTLSAVVGAVIAAGIGAWAANRAALVQERLERLKYEARVTAYWWHMRMVLGPVLDQMEQAVTTALYLRAGREASPRMIEASDELSGANWENHALLGGNVVSELASTEDLLRRYNGLILETSPGDPPVIDFEWLEIMHPLARFVEDKNGAPRRATYRDLILLCAYEIDHQLQRLIAVPDTTPPGVSGGVFGPVWIRQSLLNLSTAQD